MAQISELGIAVLVNLGFLTLAAGALCLRIWARRIMKLTLRLNDYAAITAWVIAAGLVGTAIFEVVRGGGGQHIQFVDPKMLKVTLKNYKATEILWVSANTAVKISILHLYITLFPNRKFVVLDYIIMAWTMSLFAAVVLAVCFICRPISQFWSPTVNGTCGNERVFGITASALNLATDVIILIMPMPMLWGLHMPVAKKIQLTMAFGLGNCICIISTIRLVVLVTFDHPDLTYNIAPLAMWTNLEPILGVFNACLPVVRPVFRKLCRSNLSTGSTQSRGGIKYNPSWVGSLAKTRIRNNPPGSHQFDDLSYPLTNQSTTFDHTPDPRSGSEGFNGERQHIVSYNEIPEMITRSRNDQPT